MALTYEQMMASARNDEDRQTEDVFGPADASSVGDLIEDQNFNIVEKYMDQRFGMSEMTHDRQKIVDSYVNHMRKFNFGQSVTTLGEMTYLHNPAKEEGEINSRRAAAADAYQLFDNMKGAFSGETTFGQKLDAVGDYARALIIDPANLASLGVGKLAAQAGMKGVTAAAKKAAMSFAKKQLRERGIKKPTEKLLREEAFKQERKILSRMLQSEAGKEAAQKSAKMEIGATALSDAAFGLSVDWAYQESFEKAGLQTDYDAVQGSVAFAGGLFGGGIAYGLNRISKGGSESVGASAKFFADAAEAKAKAADLAGEEVRRQTKEATENLKADPEAVESLSRDLADTKARLGDWFNKVRRGDMARAVPLEPGSPGTPRSDIILDLFLRGSPQDGFEGVSTILAKRGIKQPIGREGFANHFDWLSSTVMEMPDSVIDDIQGIFDETLGKFIPDFKGKTLEQGLDVLSSEVSQSARYLNILSKTSRAIGYEPETDEPLQRLIGAAKAELDSKQAEMSAKEMIAEGMTPFAARKAAVSKGAAKFQNNFIRTLVTHPGTTMLNLIGWTQASALQSITDTTRGVLYGPASFALSVMGRKADAVQARNKGIQLLKLQKQKISNILDPNATFNEAMDFFAHNPKAQKEMFRFMAGEIEMEDTLKQLNIKIDDMDKPGVPEKVMDFFQTVYGVKAQDFLTKTQEFMYNIDKQVRLKYNMSYSEFIADADLYKKMDGEEYAEVTATAVSDTLRNVFSKSYKPKSEDIDKSALGYVAAAIEDARRVPVVGALVPFGKFFNNTVVHMADYTGISFMHKYLGKSERDPYELAIKGAVGLGLIGAWGAYDYKNMEEGLAWNEDRMSDGTIRDRKYDFPFSFYKAMGRMAAHQHRDGYVPKELVADITATFGIESITRQLGEVSKAPYQLLLDLSAGDIDAVKSNASSAVGGAVSMYISGYTRPLDPINQVAAISRGEDYVAVDRNDGSKWLNNSVRYVDQMFDAMDLSVQEMLGQKAPQEKKRALSDAPGKAPIGRLFGFREKDAPSTINRMFNEIGLPEWKSNIKADIAVADNRMNEIIVNYLDYYAETVVNSPKWKEGTDEQRRYLVSRVLSISKKQAMKTLQLHGRTGDRRMEIMYDISKRGGSVSKQELSQGMEALGMTGEVEDLSNEALELLYFYLKDENNRKKLLQTESNL